MGVRAGAGFTPTDAQHFATKAYVDGKAGSGGSTGASGTGVPVFVQQSQPSYTGGPYVWHQTDASGNLVTTWLETSAAAAATLPTAGLVNRWSASSVDTSFNNGQGVYSLNPSAGNILLQESTNPPTYVKSGLNGKPGLAFNGSNQKIAYSSGDNYGISQPYTLVGVVRPLDTTSGNTQQIANFNGPDMALDTNNWSTYSGSAQVKGGTVTAGGHLLVFGFNADGTVVLNVDGTQVAAGTSGTNATANVRLGAHPNGVWFYNGEIYEMMEYNKNLLAAANASDLSNLKAWARQQYGLTIS